MSTRQTLHAVDRWLGRFVPCAAHTFTKSVGATEGGCFTAEVWGQQYARLPWPDPKDWWSWVLADAAEREKVAVALTLLDAFDFSQTRSIVEVGAGGLITATVIKTAYPHIVYHATDFDTNFLDRAQSTPIASAITVSQHDARRGAVPVGVAMPDLVLGVGVEFALNDDEMTSFFRSTSATVLLNSASLVGPIGSLWNKRPSQRMRNGFPRSVAKLLSLGNAAGRRGRFLSQVNDQCVVLYPPPGTR